MGGNAMKYYASVRLEVRRGEVIGRIEEPVGFVTKFKVVKSKISPPFRKIDVDFYIGGEDGETFGMDKTSEIVTLGVKAGVIDRAGSWFKYNEGKPNEFRGQGKKSFIEEFRRNPELMEEIKDLSFKILFNKDKDKEGSFNDVASKDEVKEINGVNVDMSTGEVIA